ncbi:MAG TPA: pyridoxamine 5'-phosphate oxidase family protein [bacterium]|nr:pyridoxamine 5'-phosphate oxidase family protein [bacterium]
MNLLKIKNLIEKNPLAFATILNNKPNVIGVACVKVLDKNKILITDNYMKTTIKNISKNNNVALIVWDKNLNGYKLIGRAKYYNSGKYLEFIKKMKENHGLPAKGAIIVKISKIIKSQ